MACLAKAARKFTIERKDVAALECGDACFSILERLAVAGDRSGWTSARGLPHAVAKSSNNNFAFEPAASRSRQTDTIEAAWKWSKCAMKRRRRVPCDHPAPLGLIEQYEEVLRLRHEIHLAETDQHAARLPCDIQRTDASIRERPASVSRAQSGSDPHSEQVE
jgi:hypothetical protein